LIVLTAGHCAPDNNLFILAGFVNMNYMAYH
jgi:hypothetical protein